MVADNRRPRANLFFLLLASSSRPSLTALLLAFLLILSPISDSLPPCVRALSCCVHPQPAEACTRSPFVRKSSNTTSTARINCRRPRHTSSTRTRSVISRRHTVAVRAQDIVVAATDGVLDNVFDAEIAKLAGEHCPPGGEPKACALALAKAIVAAARRVGSSRTAHSPFAAAAAKHNLRYQGGKLDDASVVVAVLSENDTAQPVSKL